jgi:hypothetical protein
VTDPQQAATIAVGGKRIALEDAMRTVQSSASWFWWVAGLSLINSVGAMFDSSYGMVLGLGITQMIDAIFLYGADGGSAQPALAVRGIHLALVLAIAGVFVAIGVLAKRHVAMAFVVGMALYLADALIYVMASDWIGVGFHAFVLFMLWGGYSTLRAIQAAVPTASAEA